mmetsp:Transcript_111506/g.296357  ORF Transcript_111506/g.296357 Transcript_111506/m.296357 type:complete len:339 (+) Transcript_111506:447-1463(+)
MVLLSSRSAAETSLVSCVERSNSNCALASRRCSLRLAIFSSTAATSGAFNHGSRKARSCSRTFSRRCLTSSFAAFAFALASRFFCSSSTFFFRTSDDASSSLRLASAASSFCRTLSSTSDCSAPLISAMPGDPSRHCFAVFSHCFFAWSFTTFVTAFTSSSLSPKASDLARSSVVRSTAANSGCQACANSTGVALSAFRDDSLQKSKPTGCPAFNTVGASEPDTESSAPSLAATRMPTFAFVEQVSMACFLPGLTMITRASPKPFDWTSATFCSALQVLPRPLSFWQPEPSFERFSNVAGLSREAASSVNALAVPFPSSWATTRRSASMMGSAKRART